LKPWWADSIGTAGMKRRSPLRKYLILTEQAIQTALAYRVVLFVSLLTGLIQVVVLYYIWSVVYVGRQELLGFTRSDIVTYIFVGYVARSLYSFYTETQISARIRDGSVAMDLIKPLNFQLARFFESLGGVAIEGIVLGAFVLAIGFGVFRIAPPVSAVAGAAFAVSLALSVLVNFTLSYLVGLLSFWTTSVHGFVNSKRFIADFFSGGLIPITFFPLWLRGIAEFLPFQAIVHLPVSIYLGRATGAGVAAALGVQAVWVAILWAAGHLLWTAACRRITIYGG
jgi:ABC-2 type transport system permease protein